MSNLQQSSVLIVDDKPTNIKLLFDILNQFGFRVSVAKSGESAISKVQEALPDLILLDVMMPGIDGFETCRRLKADPKTEAIPVIFLSALDEATDKVKAFNAGGIDYITKPFQTEEVLARIKNQLSIQAMKAEVEQLNAELEQRVLQRTAQLEVANQDLKKQIADRQLAEESLSQSEAQFRLTFELAPVGMVVETLDGRFARVNHSLCDTLGYTSQELLNQTWAEVAHPEDLAAFLSLNHKLRQGEIHEFQIEHRCLTKNGSIVHGILQVALLQDYEGNPLHFISQFLDITERKQAEEQLLYSALYDALTGLPNRTLLIQLLERALQRSKQQVDYLFAVLFIDFDRFKVINDSLGYQVGDQLLARIAHELKAIVRTTDTVVRFGGDEFVILIEPITNIHDAIHIAEQILELLRSPFHIGGREVFTSASIGITLSSQDYSKQLDLLRDADMAMFRAKKKGKACYEVFNQVMYTQALEQMQLESDLRLALENQEFRVYYQPVVSLITGKLTGFEALIRWQHPVRGLVSPAEFIPIAEETGLIVSIGEWVLRSACYQTSVWQSKFSTLVPLKIHVNLSAKQLRDPNFIEKIDSVLVQTGLQGANLKLELTESMLMENVNELVNILSMLRMRGIELSIDDFGTGYSCLSYLHRFPLNYLKIDRSFVSRLGVNGENREIIATIVTLAHQLGMQVIAEGIETSSQLNQLQKLKCEEGQGYLFAKPLERESAETLLRSYQFLHLDAISSGIMAR